MQTISVSRLILLAALFMLAVDNFTFFNNVLDVYPANFQNLFYVASLGLVIFCVNVLLLSLVCFRATIKPALILITLVTSISAYFMDTYNIIIDQVMIDNIVQSDLNEILELTNAGLLTYIGLLGVLPGLLISQLKISPASPGDTIIAHLKLIGFSLLTIIITILAFSDFYASFFREHKPLRFYSNPSNYLYSGISYVSAKFTHEPVTLSTVGLDAHIRPGKGPRKLAIFVVGETARADHFSLNGYARETNPLLEQETLVNFKQVTACGTSTAYSLPCMFSLSNREDYEPNKARNSENVLDVLKRSGVNVLWLDNNSNAKGVADRVFFKSYRNAKTNPVCDAECRDVGMLSNLQELVDQQPEGDIFIVLHQMGNHGPAYYKRYPAKFEKFIPACKDNQLEKCSKEEIINAYDNALLYTDYFLSKAIALLKANDARFLTSLLYVSDHGESLGENGIYLHGMPYFIAPEAQLHVPMFMWFGEKYGEHLVDGLANNTSKPYSHDNVFHTILGLMNIETEIYNQNLDILKDN